MGREPTIYEEQLEAQKKAQEQLEKRQRLESFGEGMEAVGSAFLWLGIGIVVIGLVLIPITLS